TPMRRRAQRREGWSMTQSTMAAPAGHDPTPARRRRAIDGALGLVLATGLWLHVRMYWFVLDDAYISFRYAQHLATGHGLVFNIGGERVEGYTNWLWVLWLGVAAKCGVRPEASAPWTTAIATVALAATAALWGRARLTVRERPYAWIAPLLLVCNRSFCVWATSGLETRVFEAFAPVGLARAWHDARVARARPWASVCFALAVWTRPDAALPAVVTAIAVAIQRRRGGRFDLRKALASIAPFVL